ncbi:MAG: LuxR C-terminal-related transcriptional regulator [Pseudomonadota bacterium]|nr:LuxR C-terminal-related transcriptional regulator [Pseudomonadota bacterium]
MASDPATPSLRLVRGAFALVVLLVAGDAALDLSEGAELFHVAGEALVVAVALFGLGAVTRRVRADRARLEAEVGRLRGDEAAWRASAARWEAQARAAVRAFAEAVDTEFDHWQLTASERDVALLLLKGMSMKDIASARGTSERTVRQQAATVYAKAGVEGRAELASYFLDALSLPAPSLPSSLVAPSSPRRGDPMSSSSG